MVTILRAVPMLCDVLVLAAFYFAIYGVLTITLFAGTLNVRLACKPLPHVGCCWNPLSPPLCQYQALVLECDGVISVVV